MDPTETKQQSSKNRLYSKDARVLHHPSSEAIDAANSAVDAAQKELEENTALINSIEAGISRLSAVLSQLDDTRKKINKEQ